MTALEKARHAIQASAAAVDATYRHRYHAMPPASWMNDPNGLCYFRGEYHLFYQHNPFGPRWGRMHWGHATTKDFLRWEHRPIALAPDKRYDSLLGCFSGSALVVRDAKGVAVRAAGATGPAAGTVAGDAAGDELRLMYTGVSPAGQRQCLAVSRDGIEFAKDQANPLIGGRALPKGRSALSFRDPELFEREGIYYCLLGSCDTRKRPHEGELLLFRSRDFRAWDYVGVAYSCPDSPMLECPDLSIVDGRELLLFSPTELPRRGDEFQNLHSAVYALGALDCETGAFAGTPYREIDSGFDFYAPQTLTTPDGRVVMIAWMQMWKRSMPTEPHLWTGAMTLPRELTLVGDTLIQNPVREIEACRCNRVAYRDRVLEGALSLPGIQGSCIELLVEADLSAAERFEIRVFSTPFEPRNLVITTAAPGAHATGRGDERADERAAARFVVIAWDRASRRLSMDRGSAGEPILDLSEGGKPSTLRYRSLDPVGGILKLRLFLDISSVELFAQEGAIAMTGNAYPEPGQSGIVFSSQGRVLLREMEKYDIEP